MRIENAVKGMLEEAGVVDVFTAPPSVLACAEPVVVGRAVFERGMELAYGERGTARVPVLACRESMDGAREAASLCAGALRAAGWVRFADVGGARICSMGVGAPAFGERDGSGRFVYEVGVAVDVARGGA